MDLLDNAIYLDDLQYIAGLELPWDKLVNSTLLISGATGLIGSMLVDALMTRGRLYGGGIRVIAIGRNEKRARARFARYWDNPLFTFAAQDVNKPIPELGCADYIIHAASNTHPVAYASDPIGTITTNVLGTYNLLDYASKHDCRRFVFLSTVEIYGESTGASERFEEADMGYIDCNTLRAGYPESKRTGEALCNAFASQSGVDFVTARLCRIYGPTILDDDQKSTSQFIWKAVRSEDIVLKSEGKQLYSCCYCADTVSAILYIMMMGKSGEAYNVADDKSDATLREIAEHLAATAGRQVVYEIPSQLETRGFSKLTRALLEPSKLRGLGWSAKDTIGSGLDKTVKILTDVSEY